MLNQLHKDTLQPLLNNEILLEALRLVFKARIKKSKPNVKDADNELVGQQYRAYEQANEMIEKAFQDLKDYKTEKKTEKSFTKSR